MSLLSAAKRQSMLDEIEREFEGTFDRLLSMLISSYGSQMKSWIISSVLSNYFAAATNSLKQLNLDDFTEGDDNEQCNNLSSLLFHNHLCIFHSIILKNVFMFCYSCKET